MLTISREILTFDLNIPSLYSPLSLTHWPLGNNPIPCPRLHTGLLISIPLLHHHLISTSAIVSPLQGEGLPKLVPFTSVRYRSHPYHASKLHNFISPSSFLSSLTSRTCHWSTLCCYLCPPVVIGSGKVSRSNPFLDFNLFHDILDFSLLSDHLVVFLSILIIPSIHLSMLLCVVISVCSIFFHCPNLCTICHRW